MTTIYQKNNKIMVSLKVPKDTIHFVEFVLMFEYSNYVESNLK